MKNFKERSYDCHSITSITTKCLARFIRQCTIALYVFTFSLSPAFADANDLYQASIINAALHQFLFSPRPLKVLTGNKVTVVTYADEEDYQLSDTHARDVLWVVVDSELKDICSRYTKNKKKITHQELSSWLAQLLGIPLDPNGKRRLIVFRVPVIQAFYGRKPKKIGIFRPCTDPRVSAHDDRTIACPQFMDTENKKISPEYKTWFINNSISSYTLRKDSQGFPWSEFGYTYNWNPKAKDIYGVSEFVILQGTPLRVLSNPYHPTTAYLTPEEYCRY